MFAASPEGDSFQRVTAYSWRSNLYYEGLVSQGDITPRKPLKTYYKPKLASTFHNLPLWHPDL